MAAEQKVVVAFEDPRDNFERRVKAILSRLGSADPEEDVARHGEYVARARDAELDPQVVASTVYALTHAEAPAVDRMGRSRTAWAREETTSLRPGHYVMAADGEPIAGPFQTFGPADVRARQVQGYVEFAGVRAPEPMIETGRVGQAGAGECDHTHPPEVPSVPCLPLVWVEQKDKRETWLFAPSSARPTTGYQVFPGRSKALLTYGPPGQEEDVGAFKDVEAAKARAQQMDADMTVRDAKGAGEASKSAAACGCSHGQAAPLERELRWHRRQEGGYYALSPMGRFEIVAQPPNRRQGVHAWALRLEQAEIKSFDGASEAKRYAQAYGELVPRAMEGRGAGEAFVIDAPGKAMARPTVGGQPLAFACKPFIHVVANLEQKQVCMATAESIGALDDPKKVYALIREYMASQDQEVYVVVLCDTHSMLRGLIEVGRGQRDKVLVDVADVMRPVQMMGASRWWCAHNHPSGDPEPSRKDKALTRAIADARAKSAPDTEFLGHLVCGLKGYRLA